MIRAFAPLVAFAAALAGRNPRAAIIVEEARESKRELSEEEIASLVFSRLGGRRGPCGSYKPRRQRTHRGTRVLRAKLAALGLNFDAIVADATERGKRANQTFGERARRCR